VLDPDRRGIAHVAIHLMDEHTRETRQVTSDEQGRFTIADIPTGVYRMTIDQSGYGRFIARAELAMNQEYWLTIPLQRGDMIQAIDTVAPFLPSDYDTPALHVLITDRDLNEWPTATGSFLELALLAPETARAAQRSPTTRHGRFAMSTSGVRDDLNNFLIDGASNLDPFWNTPVVVPPSDGVRQFQVFTSNYDASFGPGAGAQISAVTKSGANAFVGSLDGFFRGTALGGRNHFAPKEGPAPDYTRRQAGATLGGPLRKNRTFLFADYENIHLREGITRVTNVPTIAERTGDFSQSLFPKPMDDLTGSRFPGDVIPSGRLSTFGRALAALYPLPNRDAPFANYVSSPVMRDDINRTDVRIDQVLGNAARLTARYSMTDRDLFEPFAGADGPLVPGFGQRVPQRGQNAAIAVTHAPSSAFLNDFRITYNRASHKWAAEDAAGVGTVAVMGYSPVGRLDDAAEGRTETFQFADTVTSSRGHHKLNVGGEWYSAARRTSEQSPLPIVLPLGMEALSGNALADLLLGATTHPAITPIRHVEQLETNGAALFVQDDWRPAATFSISAGVRYEYATPPADPKNRMVLYDQATGQVVPVGTDGMPRGGYVADANNIAPRVGFAWTVGSERMNVIRAGYGTSYGRPSLAASGLLIPSDPRALSPAEMVRLGLVFIPPPAIGYQRDLQMPRYDVWNLNLQHQLGQSRAFEFGYVASRGRNLLAGRDINQPAASATRPNPRPNPSFADITMLESRATSRYNGFHIRFQQRPATGTATFAEYTVAKAIDDASGWLPTAGDPNFPQNSLDPRAERARAGFDVRHRFSGAVTRPLPFNKGQFLGNLGFLSRALADSDLEAVATFESGRPFTVAMLPGIDNSNTGLSLFGFGANDRPNINGSAMLAQGTEAAWFNTSVFSRPPFGSFGNSGRNSQAGPGYKSISAAFVKHFRLGSRDKATIDLRLEAFNLLNTVNYDLPDAFFGSPTFGQILSAGSPRRVQFGARAKF
jgi:hypothetical protein